eukprot:jgi/Phyca11/503164/fgenesh2_kg.PHYCAscaffold_3_\
MNPLNTTAQKPTTFKWEVAGAITVDNTQLKIWTDNPSDATVTRVSRDGITTIWA